MTSKFSHYDRVSVKNLRGIRCHQHDLPDGLVFPNGVAIDTEAMGLRLFGKRDRLCLVQLSGGDGLCHLVQIAPEPHPAPNLSRLLTDSQVEKIFHYGRFDIASLYQGIGVLCSAPIYCTKLASRLVRTYTDHHGLRILCRELLGVEISKAEQSSDWGADVLTESQKSYASSDVLYLHALKARLNVMLLREKREALFKELCQFLPTRVILDLSGFEEDIFAH
jgi:ribonuclease D